MVSTLAPDFNGFGAHSTCWMTSIVKNWGVEVDLSLPAARAIRSLEQIIEWRGKPSTILSAATMDPGTSAVHC